MVVFLWLLAAVTVALAVWGPKRYYWGWRAQFLKNPQANEPSETGYAVAAFGNWIAAVVIVIIAIAVTGQAAHVYSDSEISGIVSSAASDISSDPQASDWLYNVDAVIYKYGKQSKLKVTDNGEISRDSGSTYDDESSSTDGYTVTNNKGQHPYCLEVTTTTRGFDFEHAEVDADSQPGACQSGS